MSSEKLQLRDLNTLANHESALKVLNDNFNDIANKIDTLLSRDGDQPNHMTADLDCNHNDILNVGSLEVEFILIEGENLLSNYYTIPETDSLLSQKANMSHTHIWGDLTGIPSYVNDPNICYLNDVNISCGDSIDNNYVLAWDAANQYWTPVEQAGAGGGIGDVPSSPPGAFWSRQTGFWQQLPMEGLLDFQLTGGLANEGDVIAWDDTNSYWTNYSTFIQEVETPIVDAQYVLKNNQWEVYDSTTHTLDDNQDVSYDFTAPMEGYLLHWTYANNVLGQWEPVDTDSLRDNPTWEDNTFLYGKMSTDSGTTWTWQRAQPFDSSIMQHIARVDNPHGVSAFQVGAEPADSTILKEADVHDTPIDGATTSPISSNYIYDFVNGTTQWDAVTGGINYSQGNVGIGTTSPSTKLDVFGNIASTVSTANQQLTKILLSSGYDINASRTVDQRIRFKWDTEAKGGYLRATSTEEHMNFVSMRLGVGSNNDVLTVTSSEDVGIGTTTPSEKLDVEGKISSTGGYTTDQGIANTGWVALVQGSTSDTSGYIEWRSTASKRLGYMGFSNTDVALTLQNDADFTVSGGNVGIGTTSPSAKLEVVGDTEIKSNTYRVTWDSGKYSLAIFNGTSGSYDGFYHDGTNARLHLRQTNSSSYQHLLASGGNSYLSAVGNLGIGTSSPSEKLEVVGNIKLSGTVIGPDTSWTNATNFKYRMLADGSVELKGTAIGAWSGTLGAAYRPGSDVTMIVSSSDSAPGETPICRILVQTGGTVISSNDQGNPSASAVCRYYPENA